MKKKQQPQPDAQKICALDASALELIGNLPDWVRADPKIAPLIESITKRAAVIDRLLEDEGE